MNYRRKGVVYTREHPPITAVNGIANDVNAVINTSVVTKISSTESSGCFVTFSHNGRTSELTKSRCNA